MAEPRPSARSRSAALCRAPRWSAVWHGIVTPADVVRSLHQNDPIAAGLGVELVDVSNGGVTLQLRVRESHMGSNEVCHGGVLFTLADIAMAYVSNSANIAALATRASIDFVDGVKRGDVVVAEAVQVSLRGKAAIVDVSLLVDRRVVGLFRGATLRTQGPAIAGPEDG